MKLRDIMDGAFDETWFHVIEPGGNAHFFWNADYIGGCPLTMAKLGRLLDRTFETFELSICDDPEATGPGPAGKVPCVVVKLDGV